MNIAARKEGSGELLEVCASVDGYCKEVETKFEELGDDANGGRSWVGAGGHCRRASSDSGSAAPGSDHETA